MASNKIAVPVSLDKTDVEFIERTGVGPNFSAKVRSILERAREAFEAIVIEKDGQMVANVPDARFAYEARDGERVWHDLPFTYDKKRGWKNLPAAAMGHGLLCQVVENKETGDVEVWIATPKGQRDCKACLARVTANMGW